MKKSVRDRIRITKHGKLVRRSMAIDHFRSKKSNKNLRKKRNTRTLDFPHKKIVGHLKNKH